MTCDDMEGLLAQHIVGTLGADRRLEVEQHLEGCASCIELAKNLDGSAIEPCCSSSRVSDCRPSSPSTSTTRAAS
jgi:hypothetical protein